MRIRKSISWLGNPAKADQSPGLPCSGCMSHRSGKTKHLRRFFSNTSSDCFSFPSGSLTSSLSASWLLLLERDSGDWEGHSLGWKKTRLYPAHTSLLTAAAVLYFLLGWIFLSVNCFFPIAKYKTNKKHSHVCVHMLVYISFRSKYL